MKTYKINNVEVSAEEIRKIVKENPDLLKETDGVPFVPEENEQYWYKAPGDYRGISHGTTANNHVFDRVVFGNTEVYRTEEDVKRAVEVERAILRVRCWMRDHGGVWDKPDWSVCEYKYFIRFDHEYMLFETDWWIKKQTMSPIGYFRTKEDASACISACEADLKIIFGVED